MQYWYQKTGYPATDHDLVCQYITTIFDFNRTSQEKLKASWSMHRKIYVLKFSRVFWANICFSSGVLFSEYMMSLKLKLNWNQIETVHWRLIMSKFTKKVCGHPQTPPKFYPYITSFILFNEIILKNSCLVSRNFLVSRNLPAWKVSKFGVISGPYFPVFGLNTDQK